MIGTIEKLESNYAVMKFEGDDIRNVPLNTIPYGAKEGDKIVFEGIKTYISKDEGKN